MHSETMNPPATVVKAPPSAATKVQPVARAEVIRPYAIPLDFMAAQLLVREKGAGYRFITNLEADIILGDPVLLKACKSAFPCWTGTAVIFEAHGKAFGDVVEFKFKFESQDCSIVVEVPAAFRGMTNKALTLDYPDYAVEKEKNGLYKLKISGPDSRITVIDEIPEKGGLYRAHDGTGIPMVSVPEPAATPTRPSGIWCARALRPGLALWSART